MFNKKIIKKMAIGFLVSGILLLICVILLFTGIAAPFVGCFAVDSSERVFVGSQKKINVFKDGDLLYTISPKTSRGYMFTILEDDTILLSTSTVVYSMDLQGNILDSWEDAGTKTYNQLQNAKSKYASKSGDTYFLQQQLGWTRIAKNKTTTVYQISGLDLAVKLMLYFALLIFFTTFSSVIKDIYPECFLKRTNRTDNGGENIS